MNKLAVTLSLTLLVANSCLPPPPASCSSPSGNMVCFDGNTYPLSLSDCNISATYDTSNYGVAYNYMAVSFYHPATATDPNNSFNAGIHVFSYGSLNPQPGTYVSVIGAYNPSYSTNPSGIKEFALNPFGGLINGNSLMFNYDSTLTNTFVITNVNVNLISGHYEGHVRNASVYSDVRELKIYFEDFPL